MARSSFGARAQAVVGYLTGRLSASHRDVAEAMAVLYGLRVSTGSVSALQRQVSAALTAAVDEARRFVCRQKAQYVDETGRREAGQQGRDVLAYLTDACRAAVGDEVLRGLLPASS